MEEFFAGFSQYDLNIHGVRLPEFQIDLSYKTGLGLQSNCTNLEFLTKLAESGLKNIRIPVEKLNEYQERTKTELAILEELEFVDYVLLVWDVINFCKTNSIPVGLGRGSAAGSLVLYLIGITGIDPIKYGLYFERFISKARAKKKIVDGVTYLDGSLMCDVDVDICYYNRDKVIKYLEEKFVARTSKILTLNTLQGKLLIKECGKIVGGYSEDVVKSVAELVPKVFGKVDDIESAYEEVEDFKAWCDKNRDVYTIALKLRNLVKNKSVHPSAMLLSYSPLEESCPIETSSSKEAVSSYDMKWASITNLKLDLLGLRAVSVMEDVCNQVGIKVKDIDLDNPEIYRHFQDLQHAHGLFQIEAETALKALQKIKPKNLEELSGVMAVARPGAMQFIEDYSLYTVTGTRQSVHSFFDDVLGLTGGLCLYQEQLMKMANKIGFTLDEAEILRRIVGKKKVKEMAEWEQKVFAKCEEKGLEKSVGEVLWKILDASKDYSFNKSHSICYAALAAITTYLKFRYPQQFFLSLLKMTRHEPDPITQISIIEKELRYFGIKLLPPHIVISDLDFSIEKKDIRFGLLSIKGISDKTVEKLQKFRNKYSNKFEIFQAAEEAGLGVGILSALIQAGALQGFQESRSRVVLEAQLWKLLTEKEKKLCINYAQQFDYNLTNIIKHIFTLTNGKDKQGKDKPLLKESRLQTLRRNYKPYNEIYKCNQSHEAFANWFYEKKLLGYTYGTTLKTIFSGNNPDLVEISEIQSKSEDEEVFTVGVVDKANSGTSKNGTKYYKIILSDETGTITVLLFDTKRAKNVERCKQLNGTFPKEENIVIVKGKKKGDCIFAELASVQDTQIYTKLKELKMAQETKEEQEKEPEKELTKI